MLTILLLILIVLLLTGGIGYGFRGRRGVWTRLHASCACDRGARADVGGVGTAGPGDEVVHPTWERTSRLGARGRSGEPHPARV